MLVTECAAKVVGAIGGHEDFAVECGDDDRAFVSGVEAFELVFGQIGQISGFGYINVACDEDGFVAQTIGDVGQADAVLRRIAYDVFDRL